MIGRTLGRYRIRELLGAGGMGAVYRAVDTRLLRDVAVKVLPPEFATETEARQRFEREALAVAALSHPNILAIHDFGAEDGIAYAVMELLDGRTLRSELAATGPMPFATVLERAVQTARGLAAAHDKNIVHRDLKPENLFVTRHDQLKILDFGVAKSLAPIDHEQVETSDAIGQTQTGKLIGTAPYMSPEQAMGADVDTRSDLFALGIVLYEMLSGGNPFRRDTPIATMVAILRDEPDPIESVRSETPPELAVLVRECLSKSREQRPQTAHDLARRLDLCRETTTGGGGAFAVAANAIDSLAVLPFRNEGGDADTDFLSDGITDNLIDSLAQLPSLKVMARSTVFQYRDDDTPPRDIARSLGVRAVLTGRLRQRGDTLVVRTELVDSADGTRLWGERFDRTSADLLAIEDEIAREIADKLRIELTADEKGRIGKRHTEDAEAYEMYMRGRHVWNQWKTPDGMRTAIGFFERARARDPLFARAFAGLADSYNMLGNVKALPPGEAYPQAKTIALQGLAIDDGVAELHTSLGFIHRHWDWDWAAAEREYRRAIELSPGYAQAHRWLGHLLAGLGRHDEAIAVSRQAVELDPLSLIIRGALGDSLFYARRYDEAIDLYRQTLEMDPNFLAGHTDLARSLELAGRYDEAIAEFQAAAALAPKGPPEPSSGLAHVYAQMGRRDEALAIVEQLIELGRSKYVSPYGIASIHACLKEVDSALDWLERAHRQHDQTLVWVKVHPRLDPVREHPRYRALLEKMNLG